MKITHRAHEIHIWREKCASDVEQWVYTVFDGKGGQRLAAHTEIDSPAALIQQIVAQIDRELERPIPWGPLKP